MCMCVLYAHNIAMSHADLEHACVCTLELQLHLLIPGLLHCHISHMHDLSNHNIIMSVNAC